MNLPVIAVAAQTKLTSASSIWLKLSGTLSVSPVHVNSGYRCKKHNSQVSKVKNSYHTQGLAADLACSLGAVKMFETVKKLKAEGKLPDLEYCILYNWGIHIDCGSKRKNMWEVRT